MSVQRDSNSLAQDIFNKVRDKSQLKKVRIKIGNTEREFYVISGDGRGNYAAANNLPRTQMQVQKLAQLTIEANVDQYTHDHCDNNANYQNFKERQFRKISLVSNNGVHYGSDNAHSQSEIVSHNDVKLTGQETAEFEEITEEYIDPYFGIEDDDDELSYEYDDYMNRRINELRDETISYPEPYQIQLNSQDEHRSVGDLKGEYGWELRSFSKATNSWKEITREIDSCGRQGIEEWSEQYDWWCNCGQNESIHNGNKNGKYSYQKMRYPDPSSNDDTEESDDGYATERTHHNQDQTYPFANHKNPIPPNDEYLSSSDNDTEESDDDYATEHTHHNQNQTPPFANRNEPDQSNSSSSSSESESSSSESESSSSESDLSSSKSPKIKHKKGQNRKRLRPRPRRKKRTNGDLSDVENKSKFPSNYDPYKDINLADLSDENDYTDYSADALNGNDINKKKEPFNPLPDNNRPNGHISDLEQNDGGNHSLSGDEYILVETKGSDSSSNSDSDLDLPQDLHTPNDDPSINSPDILPDVSDSSSSSDDTDYEEMTPRSGNIDDKSLQKKGLSRDPIMPLPTGQTIELGDNSNENVPDYDSESSENQLHKVGKRKNAKKTNKRNNAPTLAEEPKMDHGNGDISGLLLVEVTAQKMDNAAKRIKNEQNPNMVPELSDNPDIQSAAIDPSLLHMDGYILIERMDEMSDADDNSINSSKVKDMELHNRRKLELKNKRIEQQKIKKIQKKKKIIKPIANRPGAKDFTNWKIEDNQLTTRMEKMRDNFGVNQHKPFMTDLVLDYLNVVEAEKKYGKDGSINIAEETKKLEKELEQTHLGVLGEQVDDKNKQIKRQDLAGLNIDQKKLYIWWKGYMTKRKTSVPRSNKVELQLQQKVKKSSPSMKLYMQHQMYKTLKSKSLSVFVDSKGVMEKVKEVEAQINQD